MTFQCYSIDAIPFHDSASGGTVEREGTLGKQMQPHLFPKHDALKTFSPAQWATFQVEGEMDVSPN